MRAQYILYLTALTSGLLSCGREEMDLIPEDAQLPSFQVVAEIASDAGTRTSLFQEQKVYWEEGDQIGLYFDGSPSASQFVLSEGAGTPNGVFSGGSSGDSMMAVYPYKIAGSVSGNTLSLTLPDEQAYAEGSFGANANPMLGTGENGVLTFRNMCSVLKLSITGHHTVTDIVFETNNPQVKVSGAATVSSENGIPILSMASDASASVSLVTGGVLLKDSEPTDFFLVLPAQTYTDGFTVTVKTMTGSMTKSLTSSVTLERSMVHAASAFAVRLDDGVEPSTVLQGSGTAADPFQVASLADLLLVQSAINAEEGAIPTLSGATVAAGSAYYLLLNDIDLSPVCGESVGRNWTPIGNSFSGSFDGGGHQITNLYINDTDATYQGLFGKASNAIIRNLTVSGSITVRSDSGIVAAEALYLDHCVSQGSLTVVSGGYAGGLVGHGNSVGDSVNQARVSGSGAYVGGITGSASYWLWNCVNEGEVSNTGQYCGGIVGYQNSGYLFNCINTGPISGSVPVGGISGYSRQGALLLNSINTGAVFASEGYVGGIVGHNDAYDFRDHDTSVMNCINLGEVSVDPDGYYLAYIGGICGYNNSTIKYCYWLYDAGNGLGIQAGIAEDAGVSAGNFALSDAEMKGAACAYPVYTDGDGEIYQSIVKALNAWAYEQPKTQYGFYLADTMVAKTIDLSGWDYSARTGYPAFTGADPVKPEADEGGDFFSVTPSSVNVEGKGGSFQMKVYTNVEFHITSQPDWVEEVSVENPEPYSWIYSFKAAPNPDQTQPRNGVIALCDDRGVCSAVSVIQEAGPDYYISTDYSRDGQVTVLQQSTEGNGIDIVLMGDAFSDREIADGTYAAIMNKMMNAFFGEEPYATFRHLFNVYSVDVVSETEGYEHDGQALSGWFTGNGSTQVGGDNDKCVEYARKIIPSEKLNSTLIIVAMNAPVYAGTCYMFYSSTGDYGEGLAIAYFPLNTSDEGLAQLVHHEAGGHGFAKLADEYAYQSYGAIPESVKTTRLQMVPYGWWKNCDFTGDPDEVKWARFLSDNRYDNQGLGCFEGAFTYWTGAWRSTEDSIMRHNTGGFNAPSREAIWYRIHKLAYGDSWQYDYEEFVAYDMEVWAESGVVAGQAPVVDARNFRPLAPPVVIPHPWQD